VYDEFVEKSKARALKRVVGDPFKKGVEQGPQVCLFVIFQGYLTSEFIPIVPPLVVCYFDTIVPLSRLVNSNLVCVC
jgi:hypothetical protein